MTKTSLAAIIAAFCSSLGHLLATTPANATAWVAVFASAFGAAAMAAVAASQPSASQSLAIKAAAVKVVGVLTLAMLCGCAWLRSPAGQTTIELAECETNYLVTSSNISPGGMVLACPGLLLKDAEELFAKVDASLSADAGANSIIAIKVHESRKAVAK